MEALNIGMISFAFHRANGQGLVNCEIAAAALTRGHRVTLFCQDVDPVLAVTPGVEVVRLRVCEFLRYLGGFDLAGVAAVGCH